MTLPLPTQKSAHSVGKATAPALAPYLRPVGNMTQMIYPSSRVITYTRDGVKRIQIITETDQQSNLIKDYVWSNQMMPVAQIDAVIPAKPVPEKAGTGIQSIETITYLYTDHLMTNRLATGQSKTIIWRWEGEAFGNTPAQELSGVSINLRFPGQYYDSETNLHYNMMRYYDPNIGRYITSDPIGLEGGSNLYSYASVNPIILMDPTGLKCTFLYPETRAAPCLLSNRIYTFGFEYRLLNIQPALSAALPKSNLRFRGNSPIQPSSQVIGYSVYFFGLKKLVQVQQAQEDRRYCYECDEPAEFECAKPGVVCTDWDRVKVGDEKEVTINSDIVNEFVKYVPLQKLGLVKF